VYGCELGLVVGDLLTEGGLGFVALLVVVVTLGRGFEAEGDEQADGDGEEVEEELADGMDLAVGRMNVEHDGLRVRRGM
jgi:hypothetical protein